MYNQKLEINFKNLYGTRINLESVDEGGLMDMHEYSTMSIFYKYLEYDPFITLNDTKNYLKKIIHISKSESGHYWFIKLKEENKIIGTFDIINVDKKRSSCEIGYGLSPKYWNQGFFKESLCIMLQYLFNDLNMHRVSAKTHANNLPSIAGLQSMGFKKEGIMRDFYVSNDGTRHNAILLSILKHEFQN